MRRLRFFIFLPSVCIVTVQNRAYVYVALHIFFFMKMKTLFMVVDIFFFRKMKNEVTLFLDVELKKVFFCIVREVISSDACIDTRRTKETRETLTSR